ncbi:MAG: hypothetical protein ACI8PD_001194 [Nitrospinales bacterium]|jgi:hypothetical protein
MDNSINIKARLEEILARPVGLPYEIKPPEAASLIRERKLLLKIAIVLEEQNQYLLKKMETLELHNEEPVLRPVKKDSGSEEVIEKNQANAGT